MGDKVRLIVGDSIFNLQERDISHVWFDLENQKRWDDLPVNKGRELSFSTELDGTGILDDKDLEVVISFRCFELIPDLLGEEVEFKNQTKYRYGGYLICKMAVLNELTKDIGYADLKIRTQILVDAPYV